MPRGSPPEGGEFETAQRGSETGGETSAVKNLGVFLYGMRALRLVWGTSQMLTVALAAFTFLSGTLPAAAAYVGKLVVDGVVLAARTGAAGDRDQVLVWVGLEGGLILALALSQRGITTCQFLLRAVLGHRISMLILEKALTLRLSHFEDDEVHDRLMRARQSAISRPAALVMGTFSLTKDAIALGTYGWLLYQFSGWAVLLVAAAGVPAFLVELKFSGEAFRLLRSKTPEMRLRKYIEAVLTREDYAKEVIVFRIGRKLIERYDTLFQNLYRKDRKIQLRRSFWGSLLGGVSTLALYGAYFWIILATINGRLSIGEMTMYLVLFRQGQASVASALTSIGGMYENNLYLSNFYAFLELEVPEPQGAATTGSDPDDGLRFEDVSFTYPGSTRPALEKVSFQLKPGEQLALVGENGSGKTTLVKLILRLYEPDEGRILLHGRDVTEWDDKALRDMVAVIFQDFVKFKLTVGENIGVGDVDSFDDREQWREAARLSLAESDIARLPDGYDTKLGKSFKGGYELSGGQSQKLALSRLFMKRSAELFILDEPTAAVDARAEAKVFEHVQQTTEGKMCIFISHRLSFPREASTILVLEEGRVVEKGSHDELVRLDGRYRELYELQASSYQDEGSAQK